MEPSLPYIPAKLPKETSNLSENSIIALNGCGSQCVTKLLAEMNLKCEKSYLMTQFLKGKDYHPASSEILTQKELDLVPKMAEELSSEIDSLITENKTNEPLKSISFDPKYERWQEFTYSKFIFKLPFRETDLFFNGNDVWAYFVGNVVFVGITDYMQKQLSDILMVEFPPLGQQIDQFESIGSLESSKTVNEIVCPISGKVIAINQRLIESPELINEDPYGNGWIFAIEASNLHEDLENLMKPTEYFKEMVEKIQNSSQKELKGV